MNFFEKAELSDTSKKMYSRSIDKWLSAMPPKLRKIEILLSTPDKSYELLKQSLTADTPETRHVYLSSVMAIFRHCPDIYKNIPDIERNKNRWEQLVKSNSQPIIERRMENKPTVMQEKKGGSRLLFNDICQKRLELEKGSIERLLISMYVLISPVRSDYHSTQIVYPGDNINYPNYLLIDGGSSRLVIADFKTSKIYGQIMHEKLPKELHDEIILSLQKQPREFLFVNARNQPFTRDTFSKWSSRILEKLFGVVTTLTTIRHLYISSLDFNKMSTKQLEQISKQMGHSLAMQSQYRWNNADDE
jgi:hypothetical protein